MDLLKYLTRIKWPQLVLIAAIFILAFATRAHLMKYELFFEFDSYFHARIISYVLEDFAIPFKDPLRFAPTETFIPVSSSWFFWYFSAAIYKIFTLGAPYNKDLWVLFVKILPAFYGALISVAMYFLGKEAYSKRAGIVMGVFSAIVPAFVYRTMAGFLEDDSLGFLWMIIGFIFLIRAIKEPRLSKDQIKNSAIAGAFFTIMSVTWNQFIIIYLVLAPTLLAGIILMVLRKSELIRIKSFIALIFISLLFLGIFSSLNDGGRGLDQVKGYLTKYTPISKENIDNIQGKDRESGGLTSLTVGEENLGKNYFANKYNALIIFPIIAIFLIPLRLIFWKKNDYFTLIFLFWILVAFLMAWTKLKFTYSFGLPLAAASGIVFHESFNFMTNKSATAKKILGLILGLMILIGIAAGNYFVKENVPNIEFDDGWKNTLKWMNLNLPKDAKLFNWWDEGHWITFIGERAVVMDNGSYSASPKFGLFAISDNEEESLQIIDSFNVTHFISGNDLITKMNSLAFYASAGGATEKRSPAFFATVFKCAKEIKQLTKEINYKCGNNNWNEQTMNSIPTKWNNQFTQKTSDGGELHIYREPDNSFIYGFNEAANNTTLVKIWFNAEVFEKKFKEIYSDNGIKIFEVN